MSTYEVNVSMSFRASHALPLPGGGIEEPHEHHWEVTATFRSGELDPQTGVVIDFLDVRAALDKITSPLNGRDLNTLDAFAGSSSSAERVARHLAEGLAAELPADCGPYRVSVTEAPGCSAAYYPGAP